MLTLDSFIIEVDRLLTPVLQAFIALQDALGVEDHSLRDTSVLKHDIIRFTIERYAYSLMVDVPSLNVLSQICRDAEELQRKEDPSTAMYVLHIATSSYVPKCIYKRMVELCDEDKLVVKDLGVEVTGSSATYLFSPYHIYIKLGHGDSLDRDSLRTAIEEASLPKQLEAYFFDEIDAILMHQNRRHSNISTFEFEPLVSFQ